MSTEDWATEEGYVAFERRMHGRVAHVFRADLPGLYDVGDSEGNFYIDLTKAQAVSLAAQKGWTLLPGAGKRMPPP